MHSSEPVTMSDFTGSVECALLQVALTLCYLSHKV